VLVGVPTNTGTVVGPEGGAAAVGLKDNTGEVAVEVPLEDTTLI